MKPLQLTLLSILTIILSGCSLFSHDDQPPYNPFVEGFTSGSVSRYSDAYLLFNNDIPKDQMSSKALAEHLSIHPKIAGKFVAENGRTIVFKPEDHFERNTKYVIKSDLEGWFNAEKKYRTFKFSFTTLPLDLSGNLKSLDISQSNENQYDIRCAFYTPDRETSKTVETLVKFSEKCDVKWYHSSDGRTHEAILMNVPAGMKEDREITASVADNKWGVKEKDLFTVRVPYQNDFSVYDVQYVSDPERYVEVTFTKLLDTQQNMQGLAVLENNTSDAVSVDGNKLRLYPGADLTGSVNVVLDEAIRSKSGLKLKSSVTKQVEIDASLPAVRFVGKGVIIPQSDQLTVPFQAIYLRGVVVHVIRVMEQNIGQFLQTSNLDENGDIMRVGRLITRQVIFFDEAEGRDLAHWHTYSLDLKKLINPEPGAIYRIELTFDRRLSAYPCNDSVSYSKQQIIADNAVKFKEELNKFDNGGYFYSAGNDDWGNYNYLDRNNPCKDSYYVGKSVGRNVLATNIGLMAKAGQDNKMILLAHDLITAKPMSGVKIYIYNYQQQLLAKGSTDSNGRIMADLSFSKPFYVIASLGRQRSYLRVDNGSALSVSNFDVSGEVVQKGIKGFIYGERGIWRPGDTLHLGFMMNNRVQEMPAEHPVIMELYNPLGQLYSRQTKTSGVLGLYTFAFATESDAPTGAWNVKVDLGGASFTKRIRVESIKPNRLKIALKLPTTALLRGASLNAPLHVEWLQGAKAHNLKYDIQATVIPMETTFKNYPSYVFDNPALIFNSEESTLISGRTDVNGNAVVKGSFNVGNSAPGMLLANIVTKVYEESGDFSMDGSRMVYSPYNRYVGIKSPQQKERVHLDTGKKYNYSIVSVDYLGRPVSGTELLVKIYKVNWFFWWGSDKSSLATFISDQYNKPVQSLTLRSGADGRTAFNLSFASKDWGTYYISVTDKQSKHSTGLMNYYDWPDLEGSRDQSGNQSAATMLTFKTDKDNYRPGEKMKVSFPSVKGSRAIVTVENGVRVLSLKEVECGTSRSLVEIPVTAEMQPNAYVAITLIQPHGITRSDLPIRLYGVVPFSVNSAESHLTPVISVPSEIKPESNYSITVSEKSGKEMAYTLAVVDEGLLDLTHFPTPDPWKTFNAREALGVNSWDLYDYVVGAYGGRIEQIFSIGGDAALEKGPKAIVNRFTPVTKFYGPFHLKKGARMRHNLSMPLYNGRVRVMVVAGNGSAYGNAEKSVLVRKPVMVLGTLPRVIGVNEEMVIPSTVFATRNGIGRVNVTIACSSNLRVEGPAVQQISFNQQGDQIVSFKVRSGSVPGAARVTITAVGGGERSTYSTNLEVRSVTQKQVKVLAVTLNKGNSWRNNVNLPGAPGTNKVSLEVSDVAPLNLSARLQDLQDYPYNCLEQTVSNAFARLFLSSVSTVSAGESAKNGAMVKDAISRLRSYQTVDGSFAYWPGQSDVTGWGTVYAAHFLLEAEARGYVVPEALRRAAVNNLLRTARNWKPVRSVYGSSEEMTQAYRLYVLTIGGQMEMGAMNRMKENRSLGEMSRWLLAAAYAMAGRNDVAGGLIARNLPFYAYTETDLTFGSVLRDQSIRLLTLTLLRKGPSAAGYAAAVSRKLSSNDWLSTQSEAFAIVAMSKYMQHYKVFKKMSFSYACGTNKETVSTDKNLWTKQMIGINGQQASVSLNNTGNATLFVRIITEGVASQRQVPAYSNGLSLAVNYLGMSGQRINIAALEQGTNFMASVTLTNTSERGLRHLVLSQIFPAGWEILNTRYLKGTPAGPYAPTYQDVRDDRVLSHIDYLPPHRQITVKINLCAVYPGRFQLPPVSCEAMYDHTVRANTAGGTVMVK